MSVEFSLIGGARVVLAKRERVVLLQWDKGIMATTLRYPYEVREDPVHELVGRLGVGLLGSRGAGAAVPAAATPVRGPAYAAPPPAGSYPGSAGPAERAAGSARPGQLPCLLGAGARVAAAPPRPRGGAARSRPHAAAPVCWPCRPPSRQQPAGPGCRRHRDQGRSPRISHYPRPLRPPASPAIDHSEKKCATASTGNGSSISRQCHCRS